MPCSELLHTHTHTNTHMHTHPKTHSCTLQRTTDCEITQSEGLVGSQTLVITHRPTEVILTHTSTHGEDRVT